MGQPRPQRLKNLLGPQAAGLRLTEADRCFLSDVARVGLVSTEQAATHHYHHLQTKGSRSLGRLVDVGLLTRVRIVVPGHGRLEAFQFASQSLAKAFGGVVPKTGASRSDYHEWLTADAYFQLGRPSDYRLPHQFTSSENRLFRHVDIAGKTHTFGLPDAVYTDGGALVAVEADAGNYNPIMINKKTTFWQGKGLSQVWIQHYEARASVPSEISLLRPSI